MATEIRKELSSNQILFMKRMDEEILPNRNNVNMATLKNVGALVGIDVNASCRTCAAKGGNDMVNLYGQLKPAYEEYLKAIPVTTQYEAAVEKETPTFDADGNLEEGIKGTGAISKSFKKPSL